MSFRHAAREQLSKTLQVLKIAAEPVTPVPTHLNTLTIGLLVMWLRVSLSLMNTMT